MHCDPDTDRHANRYPQCYTVHHAFSDHIGASNEDHDPIGNGK